MDYIPLEKPIVELEQKIAELRRMAANLAISLDKDVDALENQSTLLRDEIFMSLKPYEITQLSRHPKRPSFLDIVPTIATDFIELHGDRNFYDDSAIVGGIGTINGTSAMLIGHQKGHSTKENIARNFGMPKPEGYRKALRLMSLAERFELPIITFIDTPGAYPGVGAEERGQSEAIGKNIMVMSRLKVPILSFVIGEGGSGGALALGVANKLYMLEYAIYSVISPEGCASILLKDASKAEQMAAALKLTALSALDLGIIDSIIPEPKGGGHKNKHAVAKAIKQQIIADLEELSPNSGKKLAQLRVDKYLAMGSFQENIPTNKLD